MKNVYTTKRALRLALIAAGFVAGISGSAAQAEGTEALVTEQAAPTATTKQPLETVFVLGETLAAKAQQWVDKDEAAVDRPDLPVVDAAAWLPTAEGSGS